MSKRQPDIKGLGILHQTFRGCARERWRGRLIPRTQEQTPPEYKSPPTHDPKMRVVAPLTGGPLFVAVFRKRFRLYVGSLTVTRVHVWGGARPRPTAWRT